MTTEPPSLFDSDPSDYRRLLRERLNAELATIYRHAAGGTPEVPWEFEACLVTTRWIADELRRLGPEQDDVPF